MYNHHTHPCLFLSIDLSVKNHGFYSDTFKLPLILILTYTHLLLLSAEENQLLFVVPSVFVQSQNAQKVVSNC